MRRVKIREFIAEAFVPVAELPPKCASLMRGVATRLEATFAALKESLVQLEQERKGKMLWSYLNTPKLIQVPPTVESLKV